MERIQILPRTNWQGYVESLGVTFHTESDKMYWNESACYHFAAAEIEILRVATNEIEKRCLELVGHIVSHRRYAELDIPPYAWPLIESSWENGDKSVCGRLDFSYNGADPPKLLEYNADTVLCLLEASLLQRQWVDQVYPMCSQYNNIHNSLLRAWSEQDVEFLHLACLSHYEEEFAATAYMADTALQAGFATKFIRMDKITWDGRLYVDEEGQAIRVLYKLYPWDWMDPSVYSRLLKTKTRMIEPAWRMIVNNKAFLVLLWERFPGHPNLLPAYFDPKPFSGQYFKKAFLGGGGRSVSFHSDQGVMTSPVFNTRGPYMYQGVHLLPNLDGHYPMIGSWVIAGESAGISIREDDTPITSQDSRFVPHFFN